DDGNGGVDGNDTNEGEAGGNGNGGEAESDGNSADSGNDGSNGDNGNGSEENEDDGTVSGTEKTEGGDSEEGGDGDSGEDGEGGEGGEDAEGETGADTFLMPTATGTVYTAETLTYSFLSSNFYNISSSTVVYESELNGSLLEVPLTLSEITEEPQILIYHTHSHEFFADSDTSNLETGIVGVGNYLAELLEGYGYSVLHLTDQFDYVDGVLDRSKAYTYAGVRLKEVLAEYPTIEVMIDLHRDGVDDGLHLVTEINGKSTAMIMFFNGMSRTTSGNISYLPNTNLEANLAFSLQLKVKAEAYYPGFTRKNYVKPYRYNLHLLEKALLIEAGAQTNTFEEVKNAMEPLAVLLHIQLSGLE
ncbi:MAG: stage II sporulation protein P, partial [Lachnospiraceae bacterium]|nr:stage II sporulation protein P [Lachnospiraceae bacterium]